MDLRVLWTISNSLGTVSDINMLKKANGFKIDVITADRVDKDCAGFLITGKKYILPSSDELCYIDKVLDICQKEGITTIIPQYGSELVPLSRNLGRFDNMDVKVLVTEDYEKLQISNNKKSLYDYLKCNSYIPLYKYADNMEILEEAIYDLGYPNNPVCIRMTDGEGGRGFRIVTEETVDVFSSSFDAQKVSLDILKSQLKRIDKLPELLVTEYLPGKEYSVDCVCKNGEAYICIPRQRIETSMGVATVSLIEKNDDIIDISREIISKLNLSYNVNIQFKYSSSGYPMLVEINPRVSGSLVANYGAGVNMLELSLKLAYGIPLQDVKVIWGTKMIRYWDQIFGKA